MVLGYSQLMNHPLHGTNGLSTVRDSHCKLTLTVNGVLSTVVGSYVENFIAFVDAIVGGEGRDDKDGF